ncbi:MAG: aminodeoxychorismate/anthranilate synthase component II [Gammaproteobacteria bacterium]|nr:aminodeoxychorismate/anthranilate synthase component II [Gammaproteobacteria bacterium]NND38228.1 aminodeoxychorismate/anthranilate synthase component II [Pseudomonadales bacterium]MBT8152060.1 aminodeoxychorismate/anthranilate synthase component II [Gammaproteobacteria bacterium]NNL11034.1 aminodeoxychorismate/anthranilate synthase component II [Pseudomonadales bacterium]NNM12040.1 aminodeoxychorismate/anthranilate synthase component II [Pseudomonadales bacterium]
MMLMIDNYDSFTYNVVQYFGELGAEVKVVRNDQISCADIAAMAPQQIVISPGPCTPAEAGISLEVVETFAGKIPLLGICLGHQCIGQVFGGKVVRARQVMHGKTSQVHHNGSGVFRGIESPFLATRYHSLVVEAESLPDCFEVNAWTLRDDGKNNLQGGGENKSHAGQRDEIMGLRHHELAVEGVQFHPESILTNYGHELLNNFLRSSIQ